MNKTRTKTSKGLISLLAIGFALILVFLAFFLAFAFMNQGITDPSINGPLDVFAYHMTGIGELLSFSYGDVHSLGGYSLSCLLYAFVAVAVIFLIYAGILAERKRRKIVYLAALLTFLAFLTYVLFSSGSKTFFSIIKGEIGDGGLLAVCWVLLMSGILAIIVSFVAYFWSVVEIYKIPAEPIEEAPKEVEKLLEEKKESAPKAAKKPLRKSSSYDAIIIQNFYKDENHD